MLWAVCSFMVVLSGTNLALQHSMKDLGATPQIIGLLRMMVTGVQAYIFTAVADLFPVLEQGTAFAVTLTVARLLSCSAPLVAEYSDNAAMLVLLTSILSLVSVAMLTSRASPENLMTERYMQLHSVSN